MVLPLPFTTAQPAFTGRLGVAFSLALALVASACTKDKPKPEEDKQGGREVPSDEASSYHRVDPSEVEPLEAMYFPEAVGPGYEEVSVELGPSVHSGKWLGLAHGHARFLGPKHIVVNHYDRRPSDPHTATPKKSVLIDVESGAAVLEFEHGRRVQWYFGLGLVYKHDDERPYLLDVESSELVPVLPEGTHEYSLGNNYWVRFSPIAKRVWILAVDANETPHVYEWEDLRHPPPFPNNPAPLFPREWDPLHEENRSLADTEEVRALSPGAECSHAVLVPPRGFDCLEDDDTLPMKTEPLSGGWRLDPVHHHVFERGTELGFDLSSLCADKDEVYTRVLERSPPHVRITCQKDPRAWMIWSLEHGVRKMEPETARQVNAAELSPFLHADIGEVELIRGDIFATVNSRFDVDRKVREKVSDGLQCAAQEVRGEGAALVGTGCMKSGGAFAWFELDDVERKVRGRVRAHDLAVSRSGLAVAVVRRNGRHHLVSVQLGSP